jgi:archaellum component FlaC
MPPKRKRASSSKDDKGEDDAKVNSNNNNRFDRLEELLNSISREVSDLKNENKNMKEVVYEMKESICAMKNEIKDEMKTQNDVIKHTIDEIKTKVDDNPTPLWKLVNEWKDVFEKEVLTKLNRTEQKLFSQTCRASREAIKRAKIKLRKKFWIHELSSISQLELAWSNYQWGAKGKYIDDGEEYTKNQEEFCDSVAATNDLALLRWVREEKECAWDWRTSGTAAYLGNLEMLKYCVENGCKVHEVTCADAAKYGNLECLKYLREKNVKWDHRTVQFARENNQIECLNYALANNCPQTEEEWLALQAEVEEEEDSEEEDDDSEEEA